jgi:hypothetical protein
MPINRPEPEVVTDADVQLAEIKKQLSKIATTVKELKAECILPRYTESLEMALRSILGNCERPDSQADDTLIPWIVQRCRGVLGDAANE